MNVLFDTSVLVAGALQSHNDHPRAAVWMNEIKQGNVTAFVSAHSLAETFSVLTRLPAPLRLSPTTAWQVIEQNVLGFMEVVALERGDYVDLIRMLAQIGVAGGAVYDAVIARAAAKAQVDHILTFNVKDFRRVYPSLAASVLSP